VAKGGFIVPLSARRIGTRTLLRLFALGQDVQTVGSARTDVSPHKSRRFLHKPLQRGNVWRPCRRIRGIFQKGLDLRQ
jgi:hypothetical protein